ncbi:hypothetical protein LQW54_000204 [Pestalotiopsis sp. IQ-011]
MITTSDPGTIRRMAGARSTCHKDEWYRRARFEAGIDTLFTLLHPKAHDEYKSKAAAGYSGRKAPSIETSINEQIQAAIDLIRRKYLSTSTGVIKENGFGDEEKALFRPLDMAKFSTYFTLDVITKVAFGEAIARESAKKRFEQGADSQKDMLGAFMRHGMSFEECRDEATFMIAAGSDTTSSVIHCTMLDLMTNPRAYQTLKSTAKEAVSQGTASWPITQKEGMALPYLRAVIFEGLRMRALAPAIHARVVPDEGEEICSKLSWLPRTLSSSCKI